MSKKTKDPLTKCVKQFNKLTLRQMRTMIEYAKVKVACEEKRIAREGPWETPSSFYDFSAILHMDEFPRMSAKHKKEVSEHILKRGK